MAVASSLGLLVALAAQDAAPAGGPKVPGPAYAWEIVPQDALWGHLSEGNFREPIGVFFEPAAKELYIADSKNGRVGIFDVEGTPLFTFGGAAVLLEPRSVIALADGTMFVLDADRSALRRFNYRGEPEASQVFRVPVGDADEPAEARTLALAAATRDARGRWYVADRELGRAWILEADGTPVAELPPPIGATHFEAISDLAVSADGLIAVADQRATQTPAIHVYDAGGKLIAAFGEHDIGLDNFTAAVAVEFDEHGFLYAVDMLRHDVKVFTPAGRMVARFGGWFSPETRGRAPGELLYPADVAIAPGGPIWVAERFGQRVQVFERRPRTERRATSAEPEESR